MSNSIAPTAPTIAADGGATGGLSDSASSIQQIRELTMKGAQDNVLLAQLGVDAQRYANLGKAWQSIQSNLKSGVATLSQVG